ncbi:hypothetical protein EXN66_Car017364 [Channa argus]|uniref:Uncharacterized protein n=1 Tax=Channa argus TaxID=215402 RepID=A0A6G1QHV5_CHAAH|nr:hypothetical protein EXN66_Car017364 [Channa argus]KAK2887925.1 hypothetical protein Q8A73_019373 [Channa argus]
MEEFRTIVASLNSELEDVHRGTTGAEALKFIRLEINILELFAISADLRTSGTAPCMTEVVNQYNKMLGEFEAMKKRLQTPNDPSFREGSWMNKTEKLNWKMTHDRSPDRLIRLFTSKV